MGAWLGIGDRIWADAIGKRAGTIAGALDGTSLTTPRICCGR